MAKFTEAQLESLTDFIDNRLTGEELNQVKNLIDSNPDYKARYILERNTKELYSSKLKSIETPLYLYQNVNKGIDEYISGLTATPNTVNTVSQFPPVPKISIQSKINTAQPRQRYTYAAGMFAIVLLAFFAYSYYFNKNVTVPAEKDFIEISRNIFDKVDASEVKLQYATNSPKELENYFKDKVDFKTFVPDVKDGELVGGMVSEVNGEKAVHFIHKCGGKLIYTLQCCKMNVMKEDKLALPEHHKEDVVEGQNWKSCKPVNGDNIVVWFEGDVVCSSVSKIAPQQITSALSKK